MQVVPRWRNLLILRNPVTYSSTYFTSFHSTPIRNEKWKKKWNPDFGRGQQPSKNYIRYAIRQKRADAKKALKDLLFNGGAFGSAFQDEDRTWKMGGTNSSDAEVGDDSESSTKKCRSKSYSRRDQKAHKNKMKRKFRRDFLSDDDHPETIFHAAFRNRWYTWAFNSSFQNSTAGFEWREDSTHRNDQYEEGEAASEAKSDDEACDRGSHSERTVLGLPPNGSLNIEDVKKAFRLSALKWHPDKHQGPSQAAAEERFKQCVNAYKSLCSKVSAA
ncbi:hypothetical protein Nepgr_025827 [Nepenthes gracilis]|uniref:J domain-containing protein n=1 Tax=Nepenthes gracilis TaxID=150966 RepID=A0AAD3Y1F9_NEPGR|nr:hypothetical protein Nepgr_025827 [Nepenthes gracilis]